MISRSGHKIGRGNTSLPPHSSTPMISLACLTILTDLNININRETRVKNVLNVSEDGSRLTYNQTRLFHFSPETSGEGLSEVDTICTINLPIVVSN